MCKPLKKRPTKEQLEQWYLVEGKSCRDIGRLTGYDGNTICLLLHELGIATRPSGGLSEIGGLSREQLHELYVIQNMSAQKIATYLNVTTSTVTNRLYKFGIRRVKRDLSGKRFGSWLVLERAPSDGHNCARWWCECKKCNETRSMVKEGQLISGRSGGCRKCSPYAKLPEREKTVNVKLREYLHHSKHPSREKRGIVFSLEKHVFEHLLFSDCAYCGTPPSMCRQSIGTPMISHSSIDRVNNEIGYIDGNCVSCCKIHQSMKGKLPLKDFWHGIISAFRHKLLTLPDRLMKGEKMESEDDRFVLAIYQAIARDSVMRQYIEQGLISIHPSVTPESEKARYEKDLAEQTAQSSKVVGKCGATQSLGNCVTP